MLRSWSVAVAPLVFALLGSGPSSAAAQVELGPSVGVIVPLGRWTQNFAGDEVRRRQLTATLVTTRAAYWLGARIGLEAMFGYAPSQVAVSGPTRTQDITSGVVVGSARILARFASVLDGQSRSSAVRWDFLGGVGAGFVARGGSAWANHTGTTHPAGVLNFEARTHLTGPVTVRLMVEDFVSRPTFNKGLDGESRSRVHHDLLLTFMGVIRMGRVG